MTPTPNDAKRLAQYYPAILIALALAAAIALRVMTLHVPFERDEGGHAYIAERWLHGGRFYVDGAENKPPAIFLVYALILRLWRSDTAVRAALIPWTALTCLLFYALCLRLRDRRTAAASAAIFVILQAAPQYFGFSANTEIFLAGFVIAAMWAATAARESRSTMGAIAAGALLGCAVMFKPVAAIDALPVAALLATAAGSWKGRLARLAAFAGGAAAPTAACVAYLSVVGGLHEFTYHVVTGNLTYAAVISPAMRLGVLTQRFAQFGITRFDCPVWLMAVVGAVACLRRALRGPAGAIPVLWFASAATGVSAAGYYFPHYFQQLLPPLSLLAGVGITGVLSWVGRRRVRRTVALGFGISVTAAVLAVPFFGAWRLADEGPALSCRLYGLDPFYESPMIGRYLADNTSPEDLVYIFGSEPQMLFYANRVSPSPILWVAEILVPSPDSRRLQEQVFADLLRRPPRYVVFVNHWNTPGLEHSDRFLADHLTALLSREYAPAAALVAYPPRSIFFVTAGDIPPPGWPPVMLNIYRRRTP